MKAAGSDAVDAVDAWGGPWASEKSPLPFLRWRVSAWRKFGLVSHLYFAFCTCCQRVVVLGA